MRSFLANNSWILCSDSKRDRSEDGNGISFSRILGCIRSDSIIWRPVRRRKYIQFIEIGLHILSEPPFGSPSDKFGSNGDRHLEVLQCLYISALLICLWNESTALVFKQILLYSYNYYPSMDRYYADMEKQVCILQYTAKLPKNHTEVPHPDACFIWRRFAK